MSGKSPQKDCPICELTADLIESMFCNLMFHDSVKQMECKRLMTARREKKLEFNELLSKLGVSEQQFDKALDKALSEADKILKA